MLLNALSSSKTSRTGVSGQTVDFSHLGFQTSDSRPNEYPRVAVLTVFKLAQLLICSDPAEVIHSTF
jgi:hypothetical protein